MRRWILFGLLAGLISIAAYFSGQYVRNSCPCGFVYVYPPGGCQVDIYNQNPCQGGGGPNNPGNPPTSSGGGGGNGSASVVQGLPPGNCGVLAYDCTFTPDWSALSFTTTNSSGTTMAGVKFDVQASVRDATGASCFSLSGTIDSPGGSAPTVKIPLDVSAAFTYPGLKAAASDSCRPSQYAMAAYPRNSPCGCKKVELR